MNTSIRASANNGNTTSQVRDDLRIMGVDAAPRATHPRRHYTIIPNIPPVPFYTAAPVLQAQQSLSLQQLYASRDFHFPRFHPAIDTFRSSPYIHLPPSYRRQLGMPGLAPALLPSSRQRCVKRAKCTLPHTRPLLPVDMRTLRSHPPDHRRRVLLALLRYMQRHSTGWSLLQGPNGKLVLKDPLGSMASVRDIIGKGRTASHVPETKAPASQISCPVRAIPPSHRGLDLNSMRPKSAPPRGRNDVRKLAVKNHWRLSRSLGRELERRESRLRYTLRAADLVQGSEPASSPIAMSNGRDGGSILSDALDSIQLGDDKPGVSPVSSVKSSDNNAREKYSTNLEKDPVLDVVGIKDSQRDVCSPTPHAVPKVRFRVINVGAGSFPEGKRSSTTMQAPTKVMPPRLADKVYEVKTLKKKAVNIFTAY